MRSLATRLLALYLTATAPLVVAAEKIDLQRVTPVPSSEQIPIQDFFRHPLLRVPQLNPSGSHLVAELISARGASALMVLDFRTNAIEVLNPKDGEDFSKPLWLNDRVFISRKEPATLAHQVGEIARGYPILGYFAHALIGIPKNDRLHPLFWVGRGIGYPEGVKAVDAMQNDIEAQKQKMADSGALYRSIAESHITRHFPTPAGGKDGIDFFCDASGHLAYCNTKDEQVDKLYRLVDEHWETCPFDFKAYDFVAAGNKPGEIIVRPKIFADKPPPLQFMDVANGRLGDVLFQDNAYDIDGLVRDRETGAVIGAQFDRTGPHSSWTGGSFDGLQKFLEKSFPGLAVRILDHNEARDFVIFATYSDRQPEIYSQLDLTGRYSLKNVALPSVEKTTSGPIAGLIKNSAPWIDPKRMQAMNVMKFKTRDGKQLDAYLTLPATASKENPPPLVVLCNNGPWFRNSWRFNGEVQFLASRGYAVLQPNYRGMPGYRWMFPSKEQLSFPHMSDDVIDATQVVLKAAIVDPKRVSLMGWGFGACVALSSAERAPDIYRCAVLNEGVFDFSTLLNQQKFGTYVPARFKVLYRELGDPEKETEKYAALSPLQQTSQLSAHIRVLVAHDKRSPDFYQTEKLADKLRGKKISFETAFAENDGGKQKDLEYRVELYGRIETFLAKNLMNAK